MKNLKSKISRRFLVFAAALAVGGFFFFNSNLALAQGGVEDTWMANLGDCAGCPTDCLDTQVVINFQ